MKTKAYVKLIKTFMWHKKERCEVTSIIIDVSEHPEIKKLITRGFVIHSIDQVRE